MVRLSINWTDPIIEYTETLSLPEKAFRFTVEGSRIESQLLRDGEVKMSACMSQACIRTFFHNNQSSTGCRCIFLRNDKSQHMNVKLLF